MVYNSLLEEGFMGKSVLIVTLNMIPYSTQWGSAQRMYYLGESLANSGIMVILVHFKGRFSGNFSHKISFRSLPVTTPIFSNNSYSSIRNSNSYLTVFQKIKNICLRTSWRIALKFDHKLYNEISEGDGIVGRFFIASAKNIIFNEIKHNDVCTVIISSPPFSLFEIIPSIKNKFPNVKIILDYRDPWNLWNNQFNFAFYKERKYLTMADTIVVNNENLLKNMASIFKLKESKFVFISNGYSEKDWNSLGDEIDDSNAIGKDRLIISHVGSISLKRGGYRDLTNFWKAFESFKFKDKVLIRLVGAEIDNNADELKLKFGNSVEFIPTVSSQRSLQYMLESDILLLLHTHVQSSRYIVPGKFFDYIRSYKPILGISETLDSEFLKIISRENFGLSITNQPTEILKSLDCIYKLWTDKKMDKLRPLYKKNIHIFSREYQYSKYHEIIRQ